MFQKGHTYSVGNKGGRKAKKIEMELAKEVITQDALIKLANSKVYKQLIALQDFKDTKEMALPITLRGIVEKKELDAKIQLEQITGVRIVKDGIRTEK